MIEQLTDEERARLTSGTYGNVLVAKALRIIDAHAADRAAQEARIAEVEGWYTRAMKDIQALNQSHAADRVALAAQVAELTRELDEARSRAEVLRRTSMVGALQSEVTRLSRERDEARATNLTWLAKYNAQRGELAGVTAEVTRLQSALAELRGEMGAADWDALKARAEAAEARARELEAADREAAKCIRELSDLRDAAESEYAALRAKLLDREEKFVAKHAELVAAESRLAAANVLLIRCQQAVSPVSLLGRDLDVHLAAQPATAPAAQSKPDPLPKGWRRTLAGGLAWCGEDQPATAPARDEAESESSSRPSRTR